MTLRLSLGRIWKLSCPPQLSIYALSLSREENGLLGSVLGALGWNSRLSCWRGACCGHRAIGRPLKIAPVAFEFDTSTLACGLITHVAYVALVVVLSRLMWRSCSPEVLAAARLVVGARHRPPPSW